MWSDVFNRLLTQDGVDQEAFMSDLLVQDSWVRMEIQRKEKAWPCSLGGKKKDRGMGNKEACG